MIPPDPQIPPCPLTAEKWRERKRKDGERERRMSGPIVFPPHSELTTGRVHSAVKPPLSSLSLSPTSYYQSFFLICGLSLIFRLFPPHYCSSFSFLCSKLNAYGRWHPLAPLCAPSFSLSLQTQYTPPHPPFLFTGLATFVRHHVRIYKSQLSTARPSETFLRVTPSCSVAF